MTAAPRIPLGRTGLEVSRLCLGGNVFGWSADEAESYAVLDAFHDAGGNFIDTADVYPPGGSAGLSEQIIGRWLASRGNRDEVVIATKVGRLPGLGGLSAEGIEKGLEGCLRRLGVDHVDILFAHLDDEYASLEETLVSFDSVIRRGLITALGASNFRPIRLRHAMAVAADLGLERYSLVQEHYSLLERGYEQDLAPICAEQGLPCVPYWGLERGFLTGKYRPEGPSIDSPKAPAAVAYLHDPRSLPLLEVLDQISDELNANVAAVSLAWLLAQPTVASAVVSARSPEQVAQLMPAADLSLRADQLGRLDADTLTGARLQESLTT